MTTLSYVSALSAAALIAAVGMTPQASALELTTNGDFETGDTSGWVSFPTVSSTFGAITTDPFAGTYAGEIFNDAPASAAVIKQANIGIGQVNPGDEITISFWARGSGEAGGVQFAEFFSELDGGGTSANEILGGAPLFLTSTWTEYNFTTFAGPDVSGGVTLQFTATTGGATGSVATTVIDNVSVSIADTVIPAPSAFGAAGLGAMLLGMRRRRF